MMIFATTCVTIKMAGDGWEGWLWLSHGSVLSPIEILIAFPPLSDPKRVSSAHIVVDDDVPDVDNDNQPKLSYRVLFRCASIS